MMNLPVSLLDSFEQIGTFPGKLLSYFVHAFCQPTISILEAHGFHEKIHQKNITKPSELAGLGYWYMVLRGCLGLL